MESSLYDAGRILICKYLPSRMIPDLDHVTLEEFYRLLALARQARKLYQDDIKIGFVNAMNLLFSDEGG